MDPLSEPMLAGLPILVQFVGLAIAATGAAWVGSVAGTGGTTILLPALVFTLGVKEAIPVLTICNLTANSSRSWLHRSVVDWRVVAWFLIGGLPLVVVGAYLFSKTDATMLLKGLGVLLLILVAWRRLGPRFRSRLATFHRPVVFAPLGAGFGFLYGFAEGVGPLMAPFFLGFGLVKGAYIGTDAFGTAALQLTKLIAFSELEVLSLAILAKGLALTPFMILGTWLGKRSLDRVSPSLFVNIIDVTIVVSAISFLLRAQ